MKYLAAATAAFLPVLAAALPAGETVTISNFLYRAPAGGFTVGGKHVSRYMTFMANGVTCQALDVVIPGNGYVCDDPAYTFETLDPGALDATFLIRLSHSTDSLKLSGEFRIVATGPISTIKDQVGTVSGTLSPSQ